MGKKIMLFGLAKSAAERAAEHDAAMLRAHYGAEAEAFCQQAFSGRERPNAHRAIRLISRKLKGCGGDMAAAG